MTDTITLYGYPQFIGKTVQVMVGGLDAGDYVVDANGSVVVPFGADPDGLLTPGYLSGISGSGYGEAAATLNITQDSLTYTFTVPIVVGLACPAKGQIVRSVAAQEAEGTKGPSLGNTRRTANIAVLLSNSVAPSFGTDFVNMEQAQFTGYPKDMTPLTAAQPFSGVYQNSLVDDYSFDSMLAYKVERPYPLTITAIAGFMDVEDK
jgi:hypothetical protein